MSWHKMIQCAKCDHVFGEFASESTALMWHPVCQRLRSVLAANERYWRDKLEKGGNTAAIH